MMIKANSHFVFAFTLTLIFILFSICKLFAQEKASETLTWAAIIDQLNGVEDINETAKIKHLLTISEMITTKEGAPTKEDILLIKTNRMKLTFANILIEKKKYLWVEEIYRQIDARKLDKKECQLLFELETLSVLRYPDREISLLLLDSLKLLLKNCREELTEKPGHLFDLFQFFINKQELTEALEIATILWKDDAYHFHCGELHQRAYRLRWVSNDNSHWKQAKLHFETIEKEYPSSQYLLESMANLLILQSEVNSPLNITENFRKTLFPKIENLPEEKVSGLLEAFTNIAKDPLIIQLLKDWYKLLAEKNSIQPNGENIMSFLNEKSGLSITDLAIFLNNGTPQNKVFSESLKNASIHKKIQFLVYWNSEWEPITDFNNAQSGFRYDTKTKTSFLISQNKLKQQITFSYDVKESTILPDYIYVEIRSIEGQNLLNVFFKYDGKMVEIDKVVCTEEPKLIRIPIKNDMKKSKKWQILIVNNSKINSSLLEVSAPTFLDIKKINLLDKRVGE